MLIDDYLPRYDVVERHAIRVRATQARTFAAITSTNFAGGPIIRTLFLLRMLPAALMRGRGALRELAKRRSTSMTVASMERGGFHLLSERATVHSLLDADPTGQRTHSPRDASRDQAHR